MKKGVPVSPTRKGLGYNSKNDIIPKANSQVSADRREQREKRLANRRKIEDMALEKELNSTYLEREMGI